MKLLKFIILTLALNPGLLAQTNVNEEQGMKPYDSWHGGDLDSVSMTNGGLVLHIPLVAFPQRGNIDLSFVVYFNTKQWQTRVNQVRCASADPNMDPNACTPYWTPIVRGQQPQFGPAPVEGAYVTSSLDWLTDYECQVEDGNENNGFTTTYDWSANVSAPDDNIHQFGRGSTTYSAVGCPSAPYRALDASGILQLDTHTIIMPNGTRFSFNNGTPGIGSYYGSVSAVTDPNGNRITVDSNTGAYTDTMGRVITQPSLAPPSDASTCPGGTATAKAWAVPGLSGGTRTFKFCYTTIAIYTNFGQGATDYGPTNNSLLTAIVLPDLTLWTFSYDHYGNLTRLGFPTGGSISYTYGMSSIISACETPTSMVVNSRTVDANNGAGGQTWTYTFSGQYTYTTGNYSGTAVVTSPEGNDTVHTIANVVSGHPCSLIDTQAQYFQGSRNTGTLLKTAATQYSGSSYPLDNSITSNVVPIQTTVTLRNGHSSRVVNTWDSGNTVTLYSTPIPVIFGSLQQRDEYDFSNSLARSSFNHFKWQDDANYKSSNLLSLLVSSIIKDPAGCELAKTAHAYDESYLGNALQSSGVTMQHGAAPGPVRGNQTSTSRWLIANCAEQSSITNHTIPYDTGLPYQSYDPLGHMTQYTYGPAFYGAYLTQTNMPDTMTNGQTVHHIISGTYDFYTGLLTRFTDENSQNFTYTYDDMLRLTQGVHPDQGQTTFSYPDPNTVIRKELVTSTPTQLWDTFTAKFDGLGRTYQTQHITPLCTVLADTTYDVVGRVSTVSNPYCQDSNHQTDPTYGLTTTTYDALSRVTQTQKQDGSLSSASYNDNCTTATDEAGKTRTVCTDALGRMTTVFEDPTGLNYETDYQYDLLNNLTRVDQKGSAPGDSSKWRTRLFTYDSLSRLITALNPETGTICYGTWSGSNCLSGYDADGNLLNKTSPAANQGVGSTATTVASFQYDALNRVLTKSFTGNGYTETTPTAAYGYDVPCCGVAQSNAIGHLAFANYGNTELVYQYDPMGRQKVIFDCPPSGIQRGFCYGMSATYNQIGGLATLTYPDGSTTINYTPDTAGQMVSAVDAAHSINYVTGATYTAAGMLSGMTNGASIANIYRYNQRLQICRITASTTGLAPGDCVTQGNSGNLLDLKYDFHIGNGTAGSGTDNGNVWTITNYKDANRTQTFTYDALNRLSSAQNAGTNCAAMTVNGKTEYWGNSYTYDAWGNLTNKNQTKCGGELWNAAPALNNNQLPGYSYDIAGNMINDGSHAYTFDAENRVTKVDTTAATYTYNPLGNRVRKDAGSASTEYFYFGSEIIAELNPATGQFTNYTYFNGQRVARRDSSGGVFYYFTDLVHSSSVVSDSSGAIKSESDFYPWGGELQIVNNDPGNHYKFTSKERDSESQLDYFGARYYGNALGRFITPDWDGKPVSVPYASFGDPQSLNLYSYVRNCPVIRIDLDGHNFASWNGFNRDTSGGFTEMDNEIDSEISIEASNFAAVDAMNEADRQNAQQQKNAQSFDAVWSAFPDHRTYDSGTKGTSGKSIQELTGVNVVDTCALRLSYALNQAGFKITRHDGRSATRGSDGQYYLVAQADVGRFITKTFGFSPQIINKASMANFSTSSSNTSGFVRFSIDFAKGTATGHIALFSKGTFREPGHDDYTGGDAPHQYVVRYMEYWRMQ